MERRERPAPKEGTTAYTAQDKAGPFSALLSRGSTISTAYVQREVKVYGVLESEGKTMALFNTLSTTFFSLSAGSLFCAIGIWANASFSEKMTPAGEILSTFVAWGLCFLALVFSGIAIWVRRARGSTWQTICDESKPVTTKPST